GSRAWLVPVRHVPWGKTHVVLAESGPVAWVGPPRPARAARMDVIDRITCDLSRVEAAADRAILLALCAFASASIHDSLPAVTTLRAALPRRRIEVAKRGLDEKTLRVDLFLHANIDYGRRKHDERKTHAEVVAADLRRASPPPSVEHFPPEYVAFVRARTAF